jgi:hypothetical protein
MDRFLRCHLDAPQVDSARSALPYPSLHIESPSRILYSLRARGLRTTIEEILLDVMYEIPSLDNVRKCIVDENVIRNRSRPLLMTVGDQKIAHAESA